VVLVLVDRVTSLSWSPRWRLEDSADLVGEVVGGGSPEPVGDVDGVVAASKSDEPHPSGGSAAEVLVVDFDGDVGGAAATAR
jgi:hypothetical protein